MTKDEALKMAIEALEYEGLGFCDAVKACKEALEPEIKLADTISVEDYQRLREQPTVAELNDEYLRDTYVEGLNQPAQEPVAYAVQDYIEIMEERDGYTIVGKVKDELHNLPLYTHPYHWQGLTDDEREILYDKAIEMPLANLWNDYAYLVEQALKEKNT